MALMKLNASEVFIRWRRLAPQEILPFLGSLGSYSSRFDEESVADENIAEAIMRKQGAVIK